MNTGQIPSRNPYGRRMTSPRDLPTEAVVTVRDLRAGDVVRLDGWKHQVVVEAISDITGASRAMDVTFLRFGTAPGRVVRSADESVVRLDVRVRWYVYTNVSAAPAPAWVRGRRVVVPAGHSVSVVDAEPRGDFDADTWRSTRQPVRAAHHERPGWQTLAPSAERADEHQTVERRILTG